MIWFTWVALAILSLRGFVWLLDGYFGLLAPTS